MTGEELKAAQVASGLSDAAFLQAMGQAVNNTSRRRLRRWKRGEIPIPADIAAAARAVSVQRDAE